MDFIPYRGRFPAACCRVLFNPLEIINSFGDDHPVFMAIEEKFQPVLATISHRCRINIDIQR
jgi:hypothetical protein